MPERSGLRPDALDDFWRFVGERQRVWVQRVVLGERPPWTADEALRRYRFTNVYRVLDPGTRYAIQEILARDESVADRLFNLLLYRLIGQSETHAHLGFQRVESFDPNEFRRVLKARRDDGEPVFTGAYLVSGYAGMGGSDKVENVARLFAEVCDWYDAFFARVEDATDAKEVYSAIRELPGFGNFLAYQVFVDCTYPVPSGEPRATGDSLLPFSPNDWSAAGPGAKRGLDLLVRNGAGTSEIDVMRWLWENQSDEFARLGVEFDWLRDGEGDRVELSLADVQNCLCEFYKWDKVTSGEGRAKRRFREGERRSADELRALYEGYPISVAAEDYQEEPMASRCGNPDDIGPSRFFRDRLHSSPHR